MRLVLFTGTKITWNKSVSTITSADSTVFHVTSHAYNTLTYKIALKIMWNPIELPINGLMFWASNFGESYGLKGNIGLVSKDDVRVSTLSITNIIFSLKRKLGMQKLTEQKLLCRKKREI